MKIPNKTKDQITLTWSKPDFNGGAEITGYDVEAGFAGFDNFKKVGTTAACEITIKKLDEGRKYFFKVYAKNEKGRSEPTQNRQPIEMKDITVEPSLDMRAYTAAGISRRFQKLFSCP